MTQNLPKKSRGKALKMFTKCKSAEKNRKERKISEEFVRASKVFFS